MLFKIPRNKKREQKKGTKKMDGAVTVDCKKKKVV
jgi:hypothetical protein